MGKQQIFITQVFNAPVDIIFNLLTDHAEFGKIIKAKIKRVIDSPDENKNGKGSVRRIYLLPGVTFEESVVKFEPNRFMEYTVSKGSPIKNHRGRMEFAQVAGKTSVTYSIDFEPKRPFFFLGSLIKKMIEKPMVEGFEKLSGRYDS